jgi:hypothetical protein
MEHHLMKTAGTKQLISSTTSHLAKRNCLLTWTLMSSPEMLMQSELVQTLQTRKLCDAHTPISKAFHILFNETMLALENKMPNWLQV